ncbi:hypothetical protein [Embleya sp. NPDC020886]|uniref:hypothetical protein n=1 Tax=Embleya sp. NPDC020886 TaxID=3363980 RepID=UPI0037903700
MSTPDAVDTYAAIHAARPGEVAAAADGWRLAAVRLAELRDALAETARRGAQIWTGGGAERFTARCHTLADTADRLAAHGIALHQHLDKAAHALNLAQEQATDPTAAQSAATRLEDVYRDLGDRLPALPPPPHTDATPKTNLPADAPPTTTPPPSQPCAKNTTAPTNPSTINPTTTDPGNITPLSPPPPPLAPPTSCDPLEAPPPEAPAVTQASEAPKTVPPPPPPSTPIPTCLTNSTPPLPPPPPEAPPTPTPPLTPPPPSSCPPPPPPPPVMGTPLPRDPRQVLPAGIGPRVRRPTPPPSPPIPPVTGIRIAPGLRTGSPAATHDAAHTATPLPNPLGTTTHNDPPPTPLPPTWLTAPTTGGTPTTPTPTPRPRSRYTTHPPEAWWTTPEPPHPPT